MLPPPAINTAPQTADVLPIYSSMENKTRYDKVVFDSYLSYSILKTSSIRNALDLAETVDMTTVNARTKLNQEVIERLQVAFKYNPEVDLLSLIPLDYRERLLGEYPVRATTKALPKHKPPRRADFCVDLVARARTATIVHTLSDTATLFLSKYLEPDGPFQDPTQCLVPVLKRMILESEKLWEGPTRGVVLKCDDNLVVKGIRGNSDCTEYTSLQYLAKHAPDIPAPKPSSNSTVSVLCL